MQIDKFSVLKFPKLSNIGYHKGTEKLRICIVTEEILGPVRNGGIASTYYHLAKGLAAEGHDVHVLFLKGAIVQDHTPPYWVQHYADFGVTLEYLEFPPKELWCASPNWQRRFAAVYDWLKAQPDFDVVHTSEWRGGLVYALMAKALGLAFQNTLFIVKTSSPHLWNRHYQMQPIRSVDLLAVTHAEQICVELADMVVGGSAHLLTFMDHIGYDLPKTNVYVQPNVLDFSNVAVVDQRQKRGYGDVVKSKELVFFGRIEGRKGIELFCNAVDILCARGIFPEKVNFLGKFGGGLAAQTGITVERYLENKIAGWPFPVEVINDKHQPEALSFMCSRDMIAVMPSLIENSTMAVYETLEMKIPFIATAVGGTPELIDARDHAWTLIPPESQALADRLADVLANGQPIARPSFENEANLDEWYGFHGYLARIIGEKGPQAALSGILGTDRRDKTVIATVTYASLVHTAENLPLLLESLKASPPDHVILAYNQAVMREATEAAVADLQAAGVGAELMASLGTPSGRVFAAIADHAKTDAIVLAADTHLTPKAGYFETIAKALSTQPDAVVTTFCDTDADLEVLPTGSDLATQVFSSRAYGPEIIALRTAHVKDQPTELFEPYDVQTGILHGLVSRLTISGRMKLYVVPETLIRWNDFRATAEILKHNGVYKYLISKPYLDTHGIADRKILLRSISSGTAERVFRGLSVRSEKITWLLPAKGIKRRIGPTSQFVLGIDTDDHSLCYLADGGGKTSLSINRIPRTIEEWGGKRTFHKGKISVYRLPIPQTWEVGQTYDIEFRYRSKKETVIRTCSIHKLSEGTLALTSKHRPIYRGEKIESLAVLKASIPEPLLRAAKAMSKIKARFR